MKTLIAILTLIFALNAQAELKNASYSFVYSADHIDTDHFADSNKALKNFITEVEAKGWTIAITAINSSPIWKVFRKNKDEKVEVLVERTQGCLNIANEKCHLMIQNYNRRDDVFAPNYSGSISLPVRQQSWKVIVDAGSNYKEEVIGRVTSATMSRALADILKKIERNRSARYTRFCFGDLCYEYNLKIVAEPITEN